MQGRLLVLAVALLDRQRERDRLRAAAARARQRDRLEPIRPGTFAAWASRVPEEAEVARDRPRATDLTGRPATERGGSM
jgi:hypothetical protein